MAKHGPDLQIPKDRNGRHRLPQQVDPVWLQAPEFRGRHAQFRTNMALALELAEAAIRNKGPVGVVVSDAWSLAEDVVRVLARRHKDWISRLNTNRGLDTARFQLRDRNGWAMQRPSPQIAVEDLVRLIPATAGRPVTVGAPTYWGFTLRVRMPTLGQVRSVVRVEREALTGRHGVLVTNRVDWSAATSLSRYWHRWPTETFEQDGKGPLGCTAYRLRSAAAIGNHGCLVFVASALLHLTCLPTVSDRPQGLIHTMGDAGRQQGRAWLQTLLVFVHDRLSDGATVDHGCAPLFAKPRGIVLV